MSDLRSLMDKPPFSARQLVKYLTILGKPIPNWLRKKVAYEEKKALARLVDFDPSRWQ